MPSRQQNTLLIALLCIALLVYYLDALAQVNFYYWTFWWYDIMMHFLGGLVVSGVALWFFTRFAPPVWIQSKHILYIAIGTALVIGVGWEFFEYFNGMYVAQANIVTDTAGDLIMDVIGSVASWLTVRALLSERSLTSQVL